MADVIQKADELNANSERWRELLDFLVEGKHTETDNPDMLWRVVRAYYRVSKFKAKDSHESLTLAESALRVVERALTIDPNHFLIHKWSGVLKSWYGDLAGTKQKIATAFEIRDHFKKAIELKEGDASVKHLLGRWCYNVASVSWLTRRAASVVYGTPPSSTYQEALSYFDAAEKTAAGFFSDNWLFLGKTHYQLGNKQEARQWLQKVLDKDSVDPEHLESKTEAAKLIQKV